MIINSIYLSIPIPATYHTSNSNAAITVLFALLFIGLSLFIGWLLTNVLKGRNYLSSMPAILTLMTGCAVALFIRYGLSVTAIQGIFLLSLLIYASCSDLTRHEVDDHIWVAVLALSLCSIVTEGILSMLIGAFFVFVPQMAMAFLPPKKTLGGADIKLSTSLAFLLGLWRGVGAYILGLLLAVICITVYCKVKKRNCKKPFALIPYLSIGAMLMFLI